MGCAVLAARAVRRRPPAHRVGFTAPGDARHRARRRPRDRGVDRNGSLLGPRLGAAGLRRHRDGQCGPNARTRGGERAARSRASTISGWATERPRNVGRRSRGSRIGTTTTANYRSKVVVRRPRAARTDADLRRARNDRLGRRPRRERPRRSGAGLEDVRHSGHLRRPRRVAPSARRVRARLRGSASSTTPRCRPRPWRRTASRSSAGSTTGTCWSPTSARVRSTFAALHTVSSTGLRRRPHARLRPDRHRARRRGRRARWRRT